MNFKHTLFWSHEVKGDSVDEWSKALKREIHLARNIQSKLLHGEKPKLKNGQVSGISIPARLIGGDYFDFYPLSNGKLRIVIGDVMGKGIPAAMLMILTRGAFRTAAEATKGPGDTLTAMNNAMYVDLRKLGSFVTVFCADWDAETKTLTYANAGHSLPISISALGEQIDFLELKGVMIGGLPNQTYQEGSVELQEEDCLFLYTDGIVEAQNKEREMFKKERLIKLLLQCKEQNAEMIEKTIIEQIKRFTDGVPQKDDITMVILKVGKEKSDIISYNSPIMT